MGATVHVCTLAEVPLFRPDVKPILMMCSKAMVHWCRNATNQIIRPARVTPCNSSLLMFVTADIHHSWDFAALILCTTSGATFCNSSGIHACIFAGVHSWGCDVLQGWSRARTEIGRVSIWPVELLMKGRGVVAALQLFRASEHQGCILDGAHTCTT